MGEVWSRLIVCFEDPFWIGVFERIQDGKLAAAKVTFGSEPKDYEVSEFILRHYYSLQFSWNKIPAGSEIAAGAEQKSA